MIRYVDEPFIPEILILTRQQQTAFENIVGKEEIARCEQFLLFPQCFLLNRIIVSQFVHIFDIISLFAAEFEEPKIGVSGKGLTIAAIFIELNKVGAEMHLYINHAI